MTTSIARTGGALGFATTTEFALWPLLLAVAVFFSGSLLCLITALVIRWQRLRNEHRDQLLRARWQQLCFAAMTGTLPPELPELPRHDVRLFALLWLDCLDRFRGEHARMGLLHLARRVRLASSLYPLMRSRNTDDRLLALHCLGNLQDTRVLPLAQRLIDNRYSLLSLASARALIEIDPVNAVPLLLARLDQPGWPLGRVVLLLQRARPSLVRAALSDALERETLPVCLRLLDVIDALAGSQLTPALDRMLARFPDQPAARAQVLRLTHDPAHRALAEAGLHDPDPAVRSAALTAFGQLGSLRDLPRLLPLLDDPVATCQAEAANTLISLPGMNAALAQAQLDVPRSILGRLHWQHALERRGWLPPDTLLELPAHVA